jgi:hypothetical protein
MILWLSAAWRVCRSVRLFLPAISAGAFPAAFAPARTGDPQPGGHQLVQTNPLGQRRTGASRRHEVRVIEHRREPMRDSFTRWTPGRETWTFDKSQFRCAQF